MDLSRSWRLFSVAGIEIKAHTPWIFVFLITWSFWQQFTIRYDQDAGTALPDPRGDAPAVGVSHGSSRAEPAASGEQQ